MIQLEFTLDKPDLSRQKAVVLNILHEKHCLTAVELCDEGRKYAVGHADRIARLILQDYTEKRLQPPINRRPYRNPKAKAKNQKEWYLVEEGN